MVNARSIRSAIEKGAIARTGDGGDADGGAFSPSRARSGLDLAVVLEAIARTGDGVGAGCAACLSGARGNRPYGRWW